MKRIHRFPPITQILSRQPKTVTATVLVSNLCNQWESVDLLART
jgi:hypothetical protein